MPASPLADKGAVELCEAEGRNYGAVRIFGSLGFLAGGMAMGFAARRWALERVLFPVYLALVAAGCALSFAFYRPASASRPGPGRPGGLGALFRLARLSAGAAAGGYRAAWR